MIGRLVELMQDAHIAASLCSCRKDSIAEMILRDNLRTAERKENATRTNGLEAFHVKTGVTLERIMKGSAMLGECRRVEHDKVVGALWL